MGDAWFKFYPSDWLAGTRGLTAAETGVYITLVAMMYETGGPLNIPEARLARLCNCPAGAFRRILESLQTAGKLVQREGGWSNERFECEAYKRVLSSQNASDSSRSRWAIQREKAKQNQPDEDATASVPHEFPHAKPMLPDTRYQNREANASLPHKRAARLPPDWVLPVDWGEWAVAEGWPENVIRSEAERFRDYWVAKGGKDATKLDWQATWRNWMRNSKAPRVLKGGADGTTSGTDQRVQRVITAAARGTSGQDWG